MSAVAEQYGKGTNLEAASALFFWLMFLLEASQSLKRNCSAKSHLCPCPPWHLKTDQKRCQAMVVAMCILVEKNSSCYFLLRDLGAFSSKTSPLRLTICCFWTCSKPPPPDQDCRETCGKTDPGHPGASCAPRLPGAQPENVTGSPSSGVRSQWPAQGAPVAVPDIPVCETVIHRRILWRWCWWGTHSPWSRV